MCCRHKFASLVQIPNINEGGKLFPLSPTGLVYFVEGLGETALVLIASAGFLPINLVTSFFIAETTAGSRATHSVDFFVIWQKHFDSILVSEQVPRQSAVKTLQDYLFSMNVNAPVSNCDFSILW